MNNIDNELKRIILNVTGENEYDLQPDDDLEMTLGFSSVEFIQMIVDIEEYFEIEFDFDKLDFEYYRTYGALLKYVKEQKGMM